VPGAVRPMIQRVAFPGADELVGGRRVVVVGIARASANPAAGSYAMFCILFAKSRPDVGGGKGLPSRRYSSMASSTIRHQLVEDDFLVVRPLDDRLLDCLS